MALISGREVVTSYATNQAPVVIIRTTMNSFSQQTFWLAFSALLAGKAGVVGTI